MSEYLDKTGLAYVWGKVKGKLNNKADNDKYRIDTFTTQKVTYSGTRLAELVGVVYFTDISKNNFLQTFPSGYHIACILAVHASYFDEDGIGLNVPRPCEIWPINFAPPQAHITGSDRTQVWSVNLSEDTPISTGQQAMLTLLLEKD